MNMPFSVTTYNSLLSAAASITCCSKAFEENSTLTKVALVSMSIFCALGSAGIFGAYISSHSVASLGFVATLLKSSIFFEVCKFWDYVVNNHLQIKPIDVKEIEVFIRNLASIECMLQLTFTNFTSLKVAHACLSIFNGLGSLGYFQNYIPQHKSAQAGFWLATLTSFEHVIENISKLPTIDALIALFHLFFNCISFTLIFTRDDKESMLEYVREVGLKLGLASRRLRGDREIVRIAIEQNPFAIQHASKDIILECVQHEGMMLRYLSIEQRKDRDLVVPAVHQNINAIHFASQELILELLSNTEIIEEHFAWHISDDFCLIDGVRYYPKALSQDLREIQLPALSLESSIEHLKQDLLDFINDLEDFVTQDMNRLTIIKQQLNSSVDVSLNDCIQQLRQYHELLFNRLENKIPYIGTPPAGTSELIAFYEQIELQLIHLDAFFSKEENKFPEGFVERLQLLQTQAACGARFQGEVDQLFSLNCMSTESMRLDKRLAVTLSSLAKNVIQSISADSNVHQINYNMWLFQSYLVGDPVVRDHLMHDYHIVEHMRSFLNNYTAKSIVETVQKALKDNDELQKTFVDYIVENHDLTEDDLAEISKQSLETWKDNKTVKITRFQEYQKAKKENNRQKIRLLALPQEEINCNTEEELKELLEERKDQFIQSLEQKLLTSFKTDKIYSDHFDGDIETNVGSMMWKTNTIAKILAHMGLLYIYIPIDEENDLEEAD
jgi:hypothetical protein